jgi:large conductance mechanosensitive channel
VQVKYGAFLQSVLDFLIIAAVLFIALRAINKLKKPPPPAVDGPPPPPTRTEVLLEQIRDALRK